MVPDLIWDKMMVFMHCLLDIDAIKELLVSDYKAFCHREMSSGLFSSTYCFCLFGPINCLLTRKLNCICSSTRFAYDSRLRCAIADLYYVLYGRSRPSCLRTPDVRANHGSNLLLFCLIYVSDILCYLE